MGWAEYETTLLERTVGDVGHRSKCRPVLPVLHDRGQLCRQITFEARFLLLVPLSTVCPVSYA